LDAVFNELAFDDLDDGEELRELGAETEVPEEEEIVVLVKETGRV